MYIPPTDNYVFSWYQFRESADQYITRPLVAKDWFRESVGTCQGLVYTFTVKSTILSPHKHYYKITIRSIKIRMFWSYYASDTSWFTGFICSSNYDCDSNASVKPVCSRIWISVLAIISHPAYINYWTDFTFTAPVINIIKFDIYPPWTKIL